MKKYVKPSLFVENMANLTALSTSCTDKIMDLNDPGWIEYAYVPDADIPGLGTIPAYYDSISQEYLFAQAGCSGYWPGDASPFVYAQGQGGCENHPVECYHAPSDTLFAS